MHIKQLIVAMALGFAGASSAAVSPEEAKQLGATLTPFGSIKEGNKEGTIPPWTGGLKTLPSGFDPKNPGARPDPFADEKPLFSITVANMAQYADKLNEGSKALLKKYPNYRMDIYPSHRTVNYPQYVLDKTVVNATKCTTEKDGMAINRDCAGGIPFPIPKNGVEVMWNKALKFEGHVTSGPNSQGWFVDASGKAVHMATSRTITEIVYYDPKKQKLEGPYFWRYKGMYNAPVRRAGESQMLLDPVDSSETKRTAYTYLAGQRRVKLAPDLSYDTPAPNGGGVYNMDDASGFLGTLDRFDFKLVGKKEIYIPYNNTRTQSDPVNCSHEKMYQKDFFNPACMRFELHRVWVVEATVKQGIRHSSPKKIFYWDEDAFGPGFADSYDASGNLQRVVVSAHLPAYEIPAQVNRPFVAYDLNSGAYAANAFGPGSGVFQIDPVNEREWAPEALQGGGIR
ncbi:hypothetical protein CDA09_09090 [Azoarcus sp. DN11]|nr:hypothetical protein CDA09_09090 [Azoarcus sp. DN11]